MTNNPNAHDDLARRLDEQIPPGMTELSAGDPDPQVAAALRLANAPRPQMSPEMLARIQARVIEASQQMPLHPKAPSTITRFPALTRWLSAAAVLVVVLFGSLVPVAASSVPGDVAYPIKLTLEQIELTLATSPQSKSLVYLTQATRRISEAYTLLERDDFEGSLVTAALDDMQQAAALARENALTLDELQSRTTTLNTELDTLLLTASSQNSTLAPIIEQLTSELQQARTDGSLLLPVEAPPLPTSETQPEETPESTALPDPTQTPTATPTATLTATATPTHTDSPTPTASPTLTATLTATATASPEPTDQPTETNIPSVLPITETTAFISAEGRVNVRSGPSTDFEIIAVLEPNTQVDLFGQNEDGTWLHIGLANRRRGWIAAGLLFVGERPAQVDEITSESDNPDAPQGQGSGSPANPPNSQNPNAPTVNDNGNNSDFGCEHPGNYCNAPGQQKNKDK